MAEFIAIITFKESFEEKPDIERIEALTFNAAWKKLIEDRWGDFDPRLGEIQARVKCKRSCGAALTSATRSGTHVSMKANYRPCGGSDGATREHDRQVEDFQGLLPRLQSRRSRHRHLSCL